MDNIYFACNNSPLYYKNQISFWILNSIKKGQLSNSFLFRREIQTIDILKVLLSIKNRNNNQTKKFSTIESRKEEGKLPPKL